MKNTYFYINILAYKSVSSIYITSDIRFKFNLNKTLKWSK